MNHELILKRENGLDYKKDKMKKYKPTENKEELKVFFNELKVPAIWIKKDRYGFSRILKIKAKDNYYKIVWYKNQCILFKDDLSLPFLNINEDSTYFIKGDWVLFNEGFHTVRMRIK